MIDLTPLDVRKKKGDFSRALRGYDPAVVDGFLDMVAERMEELVRENVALRERSGNLADTVAGFREREQAMNEALVSAQQLREELRTQASRDSELLLREARSEAEQIRAGARREITDAIESRRRVEGQRVRFLRSFRAFVERQLSEIEMEEERLKELVADMTAEADAAADAADAADAAAPEPPAPPAKGKGKET
jgi:cell division initiation protein